MTWVDLSAAFTYGSKLTSAQMQNLRDNITALANGDSGAPEIQTAALATDCVTSAKIATNAVTADAIASWAVTAAKIDSYAVTNGKIEDSAVTEGKIASWAVTAAKIDSYAVTNGKIEDSAVTEGKLASDAVVRDKLKTSTGSASGTIGAGSLQLISGLRYTFSPMVYGEDGHIHMVGDTSDSGYDDMAFGLRNEDSSTKSYAVRWRYITSSDKPFVYAIQDSNGVVTGVWACEDPPEEYWGLDKKPSDFVAPLRVFDSKSKKIKPHKEIVIFNYAMEEYKELIDRSKKDKKLLHKMLSDDYEIKSGKVFTRKNLSQI